jgi:hypothetical protein
MPPHFFVSVGSGHVSVNKIMSLSTTAVLVGSLNGTGGVRSRLIYADIMH